MCLSEVISSFKSLRAGSTGVCSPHVVSWCDFAYYVVGYEPAVAVHLTLWYMVLVCLHNDFCEDFIGSVYVVV